MKSYLVFKRQTLSTCESSKSSGKDLIAKLHFKNHVIFVVKRLSKHISTIALLHHYVRKRLTEKEIFDMKRIKLYEKLIHGCTSRKILLTVLGNPKKSLRLALVYVN